jgi:predicted patatin/cPLA2 family phospholipase
MAPESHPVTEVLLARRAEGSVPGARRDPHRVALVLEGGGMRGVVSAGMTAAIERLGLAGCFDLVVGSSAGALNGLALLGGAGAEAPAFYLGPMASRQFINPARVLIGRPAVDVRFILRHAVSLDARGERHARVLASGAQLVVIAVDVDTAAPVTFTGMRTQEEMWDVLLATTRMPLFGGRPVRVGGRRYIDGALAEPIPLEAALTAGATHALVLQTRPYGVPRSTGSRAAERLVDHYLRRLNPALARMWRERAAGYEVLVDDIAARSEAPGDASPHVLGLRPPAGTPVVFQLERDATVLGDAATAAQRLVEDVFGAAPAAGPAVEAAG